MENPSSDEIIPGMLVFYPEGYGQRPQRQGPRSGIFLDRDGIINAMVYRRDGLYYDSPYTLEEFRLRPDAAKAIRRFNSEGRCVVVVSNQPGVAKGKCSLQFLHQLNEKMVKELAGEGARVTAIYYCLHHPDAVVGALRQVCPCRKPRPGLLLRAVADLGIDLRTSYMIGDGPKDVQAGLAAGCRAILVESGGTVASSVTGMQAYAVAGSLVEAAEIVYTNKERNS